MKSNTLSLMLFPLLTYFASTLELEAVVPAPDGGYLGGNTAEGQNALLSLTSGGFNTAVGYFSLRSNTTNGFSTAVGAGALFANTADQNTAMGAGALFSNTIGFHNTAYGAFALFSNTTGTFNAANGGGALFSNTEGTENTASGDSALIGNTTGSFNTANGGGALAGNTTGTDNTASGVGALERNTTGGNNTAIGQAALSQNTTGSNNIALGSVAGQSLTTGDYNIDIGHAGVAGEANTIRIGDDTHNGATFIAGVYGVSVAGLTVVMDSSGHLGTVSSSRRFKKEIKPMAQSSETILALKPVTFRYKKEIDPVGTAQFGLVAEDVEKVNPDLIVRDKDGEPYTVRYDAVNAMLLNEFLKEHKTVQQQEATIAQLKKDFQATVAQLTQRLDEQTAQIQKVSAQLELSKPPAQTVLNSQ
jgi:hypothetical protein